MGNTVARWMAIGLASLLPLGHSGGALAAKDTPFGTEFIPANLPASSIDDLVDALKVSSAVGGHTSKIWHWTERPTLDALPFIVSIARQLGLKTILQFGGAKIGNPTPPDGSAPSFDDAATRALSLDDVEALARLQPDVIVLMTEANLMSRFRPEEFEHYRTLYTAAYDRVKAISPNTRVGASYHYTLWFVDLTEEGIDLPNQLVPFDFIAFTAYPDTLVRPDLFPTIADIPAEWFGVARGVYPEAEILFTETGWSSVGSTESPEQQAEYVRELPRLMSLARPTSVTWALLQDIEFFTIDLLTPEEYMTLVDLGIDVEDLFSRFNGMGLIDDHYQPKPAWHEALQLQFAD